MSAARFAIHPAGTDADVAAIAGLFRAYADALGIDLEFQGFSAELTGLPGAYAPPDGRLLIARDDGGAALGCVALRPTAIAGVCEIKRLYVVPSGRGLGLGGALIAAIGGEARRIGYQEMRLDTLPGMDAAITLYRKAGFAPIAPYSDTPIAGTVFMGRPLGA